MSYWKCLFGVIAINLAYSAEIGPGYNIIEVFDTEVYEEFQIEKKGDKVDVQLYYECLCPFCIDFYTKTFNETVTKLAAYLTISTYPYGEGERKDENGKTVIDCQHGPLECYGNKLHACAIDILNDTTRSVFYNACLMTGVEQGRGRSTDEDATRVKRVYMFKYLGHLLTDDLRDDADIERERRALAIRANMIARRFSRCACGESMGIDAKPIMECAKSRKGEDLLEYYGKETDKNCPDKAGVPWKLINGRAFIGENEDFIPTICAYLASPPPECKQFMKS